MKLTNCRYIDIISIIQTGQGWFNLYMMMVKSLLQSAMLETSIECDNLNKKNMDLHQEMKLVEEKLKTMSLKYDNLEVKCKVFYFNFRVVKCLLCNSLGDICKEN